MNQINAFLLSMQYFGKKSWDFQFRSVRFLLQSNTFRHFFHQFPIHIQSDFNGALQKPWCGLFEDFNDELILFEKKKKLISVSKCFKSETATFGAKTRQNPPQKFLPKNHLNFRPNRHNFRNFEVEKLNFLQIPLIFTEKCENLAFFYPPPKIFPATQMSQTATFPPTRHN